MYIYTKAYSFRKETDSLSLVFQLLFLRKDNKRTNTGSLLSLSLSLSLLINILQALQADAKLLLTV